MDEPMSRDDLLAARVEQRQEESILNRLEKLGEGQATIFEEQHKARMRTLAVGLVGLLVAALLGSFVYQQHNTTNAIIDARTQGRAATCTVFQAYTDALAGSGHPATEAQREASQARADEFVSKLNEKLAVIDCTLASPQIPAPAQPGGTP